MAAVVYYSYSGNTQFMAKAISKASGAALHSVDEIAKRRFVFFSGGFESLTGRSSKITDLPDLSDEDTIYLGSPVWAASPTPAFNAIVKSGALTGKKVHLFASSMGGTEQAEKMLTKAKSRVEKAGGNVVSTFDLKFGRDKSLSDMKELIQSWVESVEGA